MTEVDVISLSSDSSRPSSPFIDASEIFNDSEKRKSAIESDILEGELNVCRPMPTSEDFEKHRRTHDLSDSDNSIDNMPVCHLTKNVLETISNSCHENYKVKDNSRSGRPTKKKDNEGCLISNSISPVQRHKPNYTTETICPLENRSPQLMAKVIRKSTKEQRLVEKKLKQAEKERIKSEKERIKSEKRAVQELQNQLKPGNCMKYMCVVLDSSLVNCPFGGALLAAIQNSEAKYEVSSQAVPYSLCWIRDVVESGKKEEEPLVIIWQWELFIPSVKNRTLVSQILDIQANFPRKSVSLIIYGLNGYFSYLKSKRRKANEDLSKGRKRKSDEEVPYLTKNRIDEELIELQLMADCNHQLAESQEDLAQLVVHITKAIAETPYKLDRQRREGESLEWFATGDNRDCVGVDKAGNGLLRLWQQQLSQFNLAGHDVAQAITKAYPCPAALMQAYDNCKTREEGEGLLKDILIRRCHGPLSSNRRVGPELSKKIFTFFSSTVGETPLSQEKC